MIINFNYHRMDMETIAEAIRWILIVQENHSQGKYHHRFYIQLNFA